MKIADIEKATKGTKKLSVKDFVLRAIKKLHNPDYNSIHVVITGTNDAFKKYFGVSPYEVAGDGTVKRDIYQELVDAGVIEMRMVKKGPIIWEAGVDPSPVKTKERKISKKGTEALGTILSEDK